MTIRNEMFLKVQKTFCSFYLLKVKMSNASKVHVLIKWYTGDETTNLMSTHMVVTWYKTKNIAFFSREQPSICNDNAVFICTISFCVVLCPTPEFFTDMDAPSVILL